MKKFITLVLATGLSFGQISAFNLSDASNDILDFVFDKKFAAGCLTGVIIKSLSESYKKRKKTNKRNTTEISSPHNPRKACRNPECKEMNDIKAENCSKCNEKMN